MNANDDMIAGSTDPDADIDGTQFEHILCWCFC